MPCACARSIRFRRESVVWSGALRLRLIKLSRPSRPAQRDLSRTGAATRPTHQPAAAAKPFRLPDLHRDPVRLRPEFLYRFRPMLFSLPAMVFGLVFAWPGGIPLTRALEPGHLPAPAPHRRCRSHPPPPCRLVGRGPGAETTCTDPCLLEPCGAVSARDKPQGEGLSLPCEKWSKIAPGEGPTRSGRSRSRASASAHSADSWDP